MNRARLPGGAWFAPAALGTWILTATILTQTLPLAVFLPLVAFAMLSFLFYVRLRRSEYPVSASCAIAALTLAQPALLLSIGGPSHGIWLACGIYAIATSAQAFSRREDARSVMQLGAALAAIQILDPLGGLIVAALLPGLFGLNRRELKMAHSAGLYALVLFIPIVTALALGYLSRVQNLDLGQIMFGFSGAYGVAGPAKAGLASRLAGDFAPLLAAAPALLRNAAAQRSWTRPTTSIALIACAISLAAVVATLCGTVRSPCVLAAAAAPLVLLSIAEWPRSRWRTRDGVAIAAAVAVLTWVLAS